MRKGSTIVPARLIRDEPARIHMAGGSPRKPRHGFIQGGSGASQRRHYHDVSGDDGLLFTRDHMVEGRSRRLKPMRSSRIATLSRPLAITAIMTVAAACGGGDMVAPEPK